MAEFQRDDWLSLLFAHAVFHLRLDVGPSNGDVGGALSRHAAAQGDAFYYAKVPTPEVGTVSALVRAGMSVVDVNVTFSARAGGAGVSPPASGVTIRDAIQADAPAALDIAEYDYTVSRFHLDPLVRAGLAGRIKREWLANYFAGRRGERLLLAFADGELAGFLAVTGADRNAERIKVIDLIAVKLAMRRRGVGTSLTGHFLSHFAAECDRFEVGTQVSNAPSIRMYEQAGFRFDRSHYVLHMHKAAV